jgi:hypothetical protein
MSDGSASSGRFRGPFRATPAQRAAYRMLGGALLAEGSGIPQASRCVGVALSREGLNLLLEREAPELEAFIRNRIAEPFRSVVVGRIQPIAQGGDEIESTHYPTTKGTFGCVVSDIFGGRYALTCDHVAGTLAGQPRGAGVDHLGSRIGTYHAGSGVHLSTSASNTSDAALVDLNNPSAHSSHQPGIGSPVGFGPAPALGDAMRKVGKTTGLTRGVLVYLVTMNVPYAAGTARFVDQLGIDRAGGPFASAGDSGAVVLNRAREVVGLLFADTAGSNLAFANPISAVASALGVDLA